MYMPTLNRFASRDPLSADGVDVIPNTGWFGERLDAMREQFGAGRRGDVNPYRYCLNNPVFFVDPSGMQPSREEELKELADVLDSILRLREERRALLEQMEAARRRQLLEHLRRLYGPRYAEACKAYEKATEPHKVGYAPLDTRTDEACFHHVCPRARSLGANKHSGRSAWAQVVCAVHNGLDIVCPCVYDINAGGIRKDFNECPAINECLIAHEQAHIRASHHKCDPRNVEVHAAKWDPKELAKWHEAQRPKDVACLNAVADNTKVIQSCRAKAAQMARALGGGTILD